MNIHEYQGKAVLKEFGLPVSKGRAIFSPEEAEVAARELGGPLWVVKSQIHAGGRGKGKFKEADAGEKGGVRPCALHRRGKQYAQQMLGKTLVTIQTGEAGKQVNRLYIEDGADIASRVLPLHAGRTARRRIAFVVSTEGGMDIEQVPTTPLRRSSPSRSIRAPA
jgi:succinyl-CoA synthetase beta subunit